MAGSAKRLAAQDVDQTFHRKLWLLDFFGFTIVIVSIMGERLILRL